MISSDAGKRLRAGHDVATETKAVRAAIGVTGQSASVDDLLTGEENLLMMADPLHLCPRRRASALPAGCARVFELAEVAS